MRTFEFKIRLAIPLTAFAEFDDTRTLITNWVDSKPEGSSFQFNYHETNLEGSALPMWVEVLMDIVVENVADAGIARGQVESALEDLPTGAKPSYFYKEIEA